MPKFTAFCQGYPAHLNRYILFAFFPNLGILRHIYAVKSSKNVVNRSVLYYCDRVKPFFGQRLIIAFQMLFFYKSCSHKKKEPQQILPRLLIPLYPFLYYFEGFLRCRTLLFFTPDSLLSLLQFLHADHLIFNCCHSYCL